MLTAGLDDPGTCLIAATSDEGLIGAVGVETVIDRALMRSLFVKPSMRRRGIGAMLVAAARSAAHTRGARMLFAFGDEATSAYLKSLGFRTTDRQQAIEELAGTFLADYLRAHPDEASLCSAGRLDISKDGIINR